MALPQVPVIPEDGTFTLTDGSTPSPISFVVPYHNGNLKITGIRYKQRALNVFSARGAPYSARQGEYVAIQFTFTCDFNGIVDASDNSLLAMVLGEASSPSSGVTSTLASSKGDGMFLQAAWAFERTNQGGAADGSIVYKYCDLTADLEEATPSRLTITGTAYRFASDAYEYT